MVLPEVLTRTAPLPNLSMPADCCSLEGCATTNLSCLTLCGAQKYQRSCRKIRIPGCLTHGGAGKCFTPRHKSGASRPRGANTPALVNRYGVKICTLAALPQSISESRPESQDEEPPHLLDRRCSRRHAPARSKSRSGSDGCH